MERESIDFRSERGRHETLLGREDVLAELDRLLGHGGDSRGWVLVKGGPGMGKSALLAHYLARLERSGQRVPHHFLRRGVEDWDRPEVVARNLAAQVEALFPEQAHPEARPESRLREALQRVSDEVLVPRRERLLLVIDGLDEAEPGAGGQNPLPRFLPDVLPQGVRVLCASRPTYPYLSWVEARDRVRRIDLDDARWTGSNEEVVRRYWGHAAPRFEPALDPALVAEAVRQARGNILYTLKLFDWLEEQPLERRRAELLPQGLEAFLVEVWQRLLALPTHERTVALTGLGLIAAAREALPHSVLADLAGWRDVETAERFLHATRSFLLEEPGHWRGERAWRPFHESFREFITRTLGVEGMRREHRRLAEHLCAWPVEAVGQDFHRHYALRHGVVHWLEAGDWQRVRALCTDLGYLETKCRELGDTALEEDLLRAAGLARGDDYELLRGLHRTVQTGSHWLRRDPRALPQLVYNWLRSSGWEEARIEGALRFVRGLLPALRLRHTMRMRGGELRTFTGHEDTVRGCAVTPDGRRALSCSDDGTLKLWDLETRQALITLKGHQGSVDACAMTPDGRRAVSCSIIDCTLKAWDLETGRPLSTQEGHFGPVYGCAVTTDGRRAVSASVDCTLKVWDLETGRLLVTLEGHKGPVFGCAVTTDGQRVLSASDDTTLRLWDLETGHALATLEGHKGPVSGCALTANGQRALSSSRDGTLKVWDLETGRTQAAMAGHEDFILGCAMTPDSRRALSCSTDRTLKVWDVETGRALFTLEGHEGTVSGCAVTTDGRRALSCSYDGTLKVWDLETGRSVATLKGHKGRLDGCAVTADGRRALSASFDETLKVWDLETGRALLTLEGHTGLVRGCAMTTDGRLALSASFDETLKVWDLETGRALFTLEGHTGLVRSCAMTADGRLAVSSSADKTLKVWDLRTGRALFTLEGHEGPVFGCAITSDDQRAVSASVDGTLKVWSLHSGECLGTLYGTGAFRCVATAGEVLCAGDHLGNVWIVETHPRPQKSLAQGAVEMTEKTLDLGIVIALKEEFRVFQELVPTELRAERDEKTGQYDYTFSLPDSPYRCVVSFIGEMNPEPAALHTERLLSKWNPRTVVMLGIAAGLHPDVRVGDVVVASQVDNYLASAKAQPGATPGSFAFSLGGTVFQGDHDFLTRVRNLESAHREHFLSWSQRCQEALAKHIPPEARAELVRQRLVRSEPELLDVHLASGPVVGAAQEFTQWLRSSHDRNFKALDMESAGLVASAFKRVNPTRTLVIRGISDYGDERKATLDSLGEGSLRRLAMHNATALLWTLLRTGVLPRATE